MNTPQIVAFSLSTPTYYAVVTATVHLVVTFRKDNLLDFVVNNAGLPLQCSRSKGLPGVEEKLEKSGMLGGVARL